MKLYAGLTYRQVVTGCAMWKAANHDRGSSVSLQAFSPSTYAAARAFLGDALLRGDESSVHRFETDYLARRAELEELDGAA